MNRQRGFNLVELAIVLVIIGLLLGGVLKGQALVTNAKIKRASNDFNGVTAAIYTYLDRYGNLPGDDDKANARWGAVDGDGNATLGGAWNASATGSETFDMWQHLFKANLVGDDTPPTNAFGGIIGIQEGPNVAGAATPGTPVAIGVSGILICMDGIDGDIAEIMDINFDDGVGNTGLLRAIKETDDTINAAYSDTFSYVICKRI